MVRSSTPAYEWIAQHGVGAWRCFSWPNAVAPLLLRVDDGAVYECTGHLSGRAIDLRASRPNAEAPDVRSVDLQPL